MKKYWKQIDNFEYDSVECCVESLLDNSYKVSEWIIDISKRLKVEKHSYPIRLFRVKVNEFGFNGPSELQNIYKRFADNDF